ncbi:polysaccharide pyruvyl transferase family protein [Acinetobacter haemolyticus]|uniref:polysaccharide pyruvyl transferase family protein n=1 Tax=Acinetobacter haemolyticus TaxID=29430 RepID=UPI0013727922|nr:polysaccharide pyruvyl transferase family protein [Acinetobacter haemolyticus]NAR53169.1 polysaccharide pyruvyl transferase family protein [Acinetobacter haemolyticus]NAR95372.1 polysaccharide pyruvyl transferase family protein [Acinetobacter haemolyticus]
MVSNTLKFEKQYDVVIKGAYGAANFGDDALLYSLLSNFSKGKKIAIIGKPNNYILNIAPNVDFYTYDDNLTLKTKLLLWGGGTQFYDFFSLKFLFKKLMSVLINPNIIKKKIFKTNSGIVVNFDKEIYLSIGFGPFANRKKEKLLAKKLGLADKIFVRDPLSYDSLSKYIGRDSIIVTEDICLLDKENYFIPNIKKNGKICIIVRDWGYDSSAVHVDKAIKFYLDFEEQKKIDFLLFAKDPECVKKFKENNIPFIQWDPLSSNIMEFSNLISEYSLIISSRYHGVIFGIIHNIPTIAIEIEPKLKQVHKDYSSQVSLWEKPYDYIALRGLITNSNLHKDYRGKGYSLKEIMNSIEEDFCE